MSQDEMNRKEINKRDIRKNFEFRDLLSLLWNKKMFIIAISLLFAIVSAIISKYVITPVYTSTFTIVANAPKVYNTKYGRFKSPITNNKAYINLIISDEIIEKTIAKMGYNIDDLVIERPEDDISVNSTDNTDNIINIRTSNSSNINGDPYNETLDVNISINTEDTPPNTNVYPITVTGSDPGEIVEFSNILYDNFIQHVDLMVKERAIDHFYNDFTLKLASSKASLDSNNMLLTEYEESLSSTSPLVDQEEIMIVMSNNNESVFVDEVTNPDYMDFDSLIIESKRNIETSKSYIHKYTGYIEDLSNEKQAIDEYYAGGSEGKFETDLVNTSDVFVASEMIVPNKPDSPNILRNVVIAGGLGLIIGVVLVVFKAYRKIK